MRRSSFHAVVVAISLMSSVVATNAQQPIQRVQIGILECRGAPSVGFIVGSVTNLGCVLRAEGMGFNAGVDIKELQASSREALVGVNRACAAAFAAVYDCPVPVIAAVQGYCLGGGIGLAGNADIVVASEDASFGLPEVDRGALGAATHLARLVPQHRMRAMMYTCVTATAP